MDREFSLCGFSFTEQLGFQYFASSQAYGTKKPTLPFVRARKIDLFIMFANEFSINPYNGSETEYRCSAYSTIPHWPFLTSLCAHENSPLALLACETQRMTVAANIKKIKLRKDLISECCHASKLFTKYWIQFNPISKPPKWMAELGVLCTPGNRCYLLYLTIVHGFRFHFCFTLTCSSCWSFVAEKQRPKSCERSLEQRWKYARGVYIACKWINFNFISTRYNRAAMLPLPLHSMKGALFASNRLAGVRSQWKKYTKEQYFFCIRCWRSMYDAFIFRLPAFKTNSHWAAGAAQEHLVHILLAAARIYSSLCGCSSLSVHRIILWHS